MPLVLCWMAALVCSTRKVREQRESLLSSVRFIYCTTPLENVHNVQKSRCSLHYKHRQWQSRESAMEP